MLLDKTLFSHWSYHSYSLLYWECFHLTYTPCQCMHLLVTQFPAFADTAAACPLLSGHNFHHTAAAFDSEKQQEKQSWIWLSGISETVSTLLFDVKITCCKSHGRKSTVSTRTTVLFLSTVCFARWTLILETDRPLQEMFLPAFKLYLQKCHQAILKPH